MGINTFQLVEEQKLPLSLCGFATKVEQEQVHTPESAIVTF